MGDSCLIFSQFAPFSDGALVDADVLVAGFNNAFVETFTLFLFFTDDEDVGDNGGDADKLLFMDSGELYIGESI